MAFRPLPNDATAYIDKSGKPLKDFYLWLLSIANFFGNKSGAWISYTPIVTTVTGAITTYTATGKYFQIGKLVFVYFTVAITTNGTGANAINATLPVTARADGQQGSGRETVSGKMLVARVTSLTTARVRFYDGTYPGADGNLLECSLVYEAA